MRTDADRWRFLADNSLALGRFKGGCFVVHFQPAARPDAPSNFYPVATAATPDEAIDAAIERWERKHRRRWKPE